MKKLILIIFGGLMLTGCATKKCGITEPQSNIRIVYAIDDSGQAEDPNNPGTFYVVYDTIKIEIKDEVDRRGHYKFDRKGNYKTSYKILNK